MKYYINGVWYTELMRQVKLNDLLNDLKVALQQYKAFHEQPKPKRKRVRR